jgi:GAF domain-containing protein
VGPVEGWPQSLKTAVSICLGSRHPIVIWWGNPEFTQFYNDAYISFLGDTKHPGWLGRSGRDCWSKIWPVIGPMIDGVHTSGEATWSEDLRLILHRNLPREEGYFTFSYSPIRDDDGAIGGIFCACNETTARAIGERRLQTLRDLGRMEAEAKTAEAACEVAARTLGENPGDIPFALIYLLDSEAAQAQLIATTALEAGGTAAATRIDLKSTVGIAANWPLRRVLDAKAAQLVPNVSAMFGPLPGGLWPESLEAALIVPIAAPGQMRPTGFLVSGLSSRLVLDADYRNFLDLVALHIGASIATARAYDAERRRAEALAEVDRVKTAFFSNVSHEFRTPLTLMLGPLEEALVGPAEALPQRREDLSLVYRNGLRLLRLVNTLLDFSRIEAARIWASYEPVDLPAFTAELASVFRSATDKAGLRLTVDCPPFGEPVWVDRDMWEKIVLNLVSNAPAFPSTRSRDYSTDFTAWKAGAGAPMSGRASVLRSCRNSPSSTLARFARTAFLVRAAPLRSRFPWARRICHPTACKPHQPWPQPPAAPSPMLKRRCAGCRMLLRAGPGRRLSVRFYPSAALP